MILRKLADAITEQNLSTIVLEILIVVIGIFFGLQVDEWNQARKDRLLEREYIERLYADMVGTVADHAENEQWDLQRISTQHAAIEALRAKELPDDKREAFARGLLLIGVHNPLQRRWGTVDELQSTGNILLLQDLELRKLIAQTGAAYERNDRIVAEQLAQIIPFRTEVLKRVFPVTVDFYNTSPISADYDFDLLANDVEFVNAVAGAQMSSRMILLFTENHMERIEALRDSLADDLGIDVGAAEKAAP